MNPINSQNDHRRFIKPAENANAHGASKRVPDDWVRIGFRPCLSIFVSAVHESVVKVVMSSIFDAIVTQMRV